MPHDATSGRTVHPRTFTEQARLQPNEPAICAWDGELTYHELDELSTRLAHHLTKLGIQPENVVPLCFEKSTWMIVAMLGVLKAGGAFAPLDPEHPRNRHEDIFDQMRSYIGARFSAVLYTVEEFGPCHCCGSSERVVDSTYAKYNQLESSSSAAEQYCIHHLYVRQYRNAERCGAGA